MEPQAGRYELGDRTVPPRPEAQWPRRPGYCMPSTVWRGGLLNQDGQGSPRRSGVGAAGLWLGSVPQPECGGPPRRPWAGGLGDSAFTETTTTAHSGRVSQCRRGRDPR